MLADDGDFKKGKAKPVVVLVVLVLLGGIAASLVTFGVEKDAEKIGPERAALEEKRILMLPAQEQIAEFRKYAAGSLSPALKEESLKRLAWAKDPTGIDLAIAALKDPEQKIRSMAATALSEYGLPAAEKAKPALLAALKEAGPESRPQIGWALVVLKESSAFDDVMKLYRSGDLAQVNRLGGGRAFDAELLSNLVTIDQLAALHTDESPAVRQMVATVLSNRADPKYTDQLIALVRDADKSVSHQAAPGLGKIGDDRARQPLVDALKGQKPEEKLAYLEALRDGMGTAGLVLALDAVSTETPTREWHQTEQVFSMIDKLADPTGSDALVDYLKNHKLHAHWSYRIGNALAAVGDVRGVAPLALRLRQDEQKIYSDDTDYEQLLKRDNKERVTAARMINDVAVLNPDKVEEIRETSEDALWSWLTARKVPSANGFRALTTMGSKVHAAKLEEWADPPNALPLEGQQPPMPDEWVVAQGALRYLGAMKKPSTWGIFMKQLKRKDPKLDITQKALDGGGLAILGMTLKALGHGAADGLNEWGDNKAFGPLLKYIEDPKEHEAARERACMALATVATDADMITVAEKIQQYGSADPKDQAVRSCLLETLVRRPVAGTSGALLPMLRVDADFELRHQVARAIGKAGLSPEVEARLFELLKDEALRLDAAMALMLGGSPETAARALANLADSPRQDFDVMQEMWFRSFGYWTLDELAKGHIFRYVDNAEAAARVELKDVPQDWVKAQLMRQFDNLIWDNGPHSFTRVVLRGKLMEMAKGGDAQKRAGAIRTLQFMSEQGVLFALRAVPGETGKLAAAAYHDLVNPRVLLNVRALAKDGSVE